LHDKLVALDRLGKSIGLFKEKTESAVTHTVEFVDPLQRIRERLNALRKAQQSGPTVEIDSPPRRIGPAQPERQAPIIDGSLALKLPSATRWCDIRAASRASAAVYSSRVPANDRHP
jgi:hypothetical protein